MKRLPGFYPLNGYIWDYFAGRPLARLEMLFLHALFVPHRIRWAWFNWRLERIP